MGTEAEFSIAYTTCVNCSDSSVDSAEDDAAQRNDDSVTPTYLSIQTQVKKPPQELEPLSLSIFDPLQLSERPPGCQPIGMNACHICCLINLVKGEEVEPALWHAVYMRR